MKVAAICCLFVGSFLGCDKNVDLPADGPITPKAISIPKRVRPGRDIIVEISYPISVRNTKAVVEGANRGYRVGVIAFGGQSNDPVPDVFLTKIAQIDLGQAEQGAYTISVQRDGKSDAVVTFNVTLDSTDNSFQVETNGYENDTASVARADSIFLGLLHFIGGKTYLDTLVMKPGTGGYSIQFQPIDDSLTFTIKPTLAGFARTDGAFRLTTADPQRRVEFLQYYR